MTPFLSAIIAIAPTRPLFIAPYGPIRVRLPIRALLCQLTDQGPCWANNNKKNFENLAGPDNIARCEGHARPCLLSISVFVEDP